MWVKLTNAQHTNNGLLLKTGLNIDPQQFDQGSQCGRGLHFCHTDDIVFWEISLRYTHLYKVEIPSDAKCLHGQVQSKADRLVLSDLMPIGEHPVWQDKYACTRAVRRHPCAIRHCKVSIDAFVDPAEQIVDQLKSKLDAKGIDEHDYQVDFDGRYSVTMSHWDHVTLTGSYDPIMECFSSIVLSKSSATKLKTYDDEKISETMSVDEFVSYVIANRS